jgi:hypothetical protein
LEAAALENTEGAGKAGCPPHPWSACNKKARGRTTGTGGSSGLPCAMALRLIRALSGDHAFLPPSSARRVSVFANLSACIGAPRPHDFAVRTTATRRATTAPGDVRPSHPAPNVRDDREPPLLWVRDSENCKFDLGQSRSEIFSRRRLDRFSHALCFLPVGQITLIGDTLRP